MKNIFFLLITSIFIFKYNLEKSYAQTGLAVGTDIE